MSLVSNTKKKPWHQVHCSKFISPSLFFDRNICTPLLNMAQDISIRQQGNINNILMWGLDCRQCYKVDEGEQVHPKKRPISTTPVKGSTTPVKGSTIVKGSTLQRDLSPVGAFHTRVPPSPQFQSYSKQNMSSTRSVLSNNAGRQPSSAYINTKHQEDDLNISGISTIQVRTPTRKQDEFQFNLQPPMDNQDFESGHFSNQDLKANIFTQSKKQPTQKPTEQDKNGQFVQSQMLIKRLEDNQQQQAKQTQQSLYSPQPQSNTKQLTRGPTQSQQQLQPQFQQPPVLTKQVESNPPQQYIEVRQQQPSKSQIQTPPSKSTVHRQQPSDGSTTIPQTLDNSQADLSRSAGPIGYQFQSGYAIKHFSPHVIAEVPSEQSMISNKSMISQKSNISNNSRINQLNTSMRNTPLPKLSKLYSVRAHEKKISSLAVSPLYLFSASYDRNIKVWEKLTGTLVQTLEGHSREVLSLAFRGNTLASCGADKTIRIWLGEKTWQCVMTFNGHVDIIVQVCFMSDNQILSSSEDQTVRLWELKGGRQVRCLKFGFAIKQIKISEDRCYMAGQNFILMYSVPDLQQVKVLEAHQEGYQTEHIQPLMEQYLVSADQTANITLWDIERMSEMSTMKEDYEISDTLFLQEYKYIVFALSGKTGGGKICIWGYENFKKIKELYDNGSGAETLAWDGQVLYSGHENRRIDAIRFG